MGEGDFEHLVKQHRGTEQWHLSHIRLFNYIQSANFNSIIYNIISANLERYSNQFPDTVHL